MNTEVGHRHGGRDGGETGQKEGANKDKIHSRACLQTLGPTPWRFSHLPPPVTDRVALLRGHLCQQGVIVYLY